MSIFVNRAADIRGISLDIAAWKDALKFGGAQDARFRDFCKDRISDLGRRLVVEARKEMKGD